MSLKFELVDPLLDASWDIDARRHAGVTSFHTSAWAKVLHSTYGHKPCYLRARNRGEVAALLPLMEVKSSLTPRRGICLPFSDLCGPLLFEPTAREAILEAAIRLGRERRWSYLEVRESALSAGETPSAVYYGHELDLSLGEAAVFAGFSSAVQRAVRKAERSGLVVEISQSSHAMSEFLRLHASTRRRHGAPPQPDSFFASVQAQMIEDSGGFIALARKGKAALAGAVFFREGNKSLYKFAASDNSSQELRPNNLVIWRAIEHLTLSGVKTLHFGRTDIDDAGLRRFKSSWGASESTLRYFNFDLRNDQWLSHRSQSGSVLAKRVFRALPPALNRVAGTILYPHLD